MNNSENGGSAIKELDVEVKEEDVRFGGGSELSEIWFSDRVHDAIDAKLAKSMIVRLLGRPIGYLALWNHIHALWNPLGEISLIDLDNEYYLVRFANEDDFHKVLSGGPWVIYGSYLTIQPWSRHFNSEEDHPSHIMVWVRLPKLPYRYYTKSLFKYIAATIGDVVRVDYNTEVGKRGRFARLAIIVDLNGSKELYGPWMQVVNRKRRNVAIVNSSGVPSRGSRPTNIEGLRFEILSQEPENVFERADGSLNTGVLDKEVEGVIMCYREGRAKDGNEVNVGKRIEILQRENVAPKDNRFNMAGSSKGRTVDSVKPTIGGSDSVGAISVDLPTVADRGKFVAVDSMLPAGRHSTVRVVNDDGGVGVSPKTSHEMIVIELLFIISY
ncbi:hypothetical protein GQ457_16G024930 [Hibiscus cannabinus]